MVIKMLMGLEREVDELSKNFNKKIENILEKQLELKNTITVMKMNWREPMADQRTQKKGSVIC